MAKPKLELQFQVENSTDFIELHADPRFITIKRASLVNKLEGRTIDLGFPRSDSHRQTVRFELAEALEEKNVYYLLLEYTTLYSFDHRGVVRKQDPVRGLWLNTLLETTNARRLLPSFDEPHWRSSFKLELRLLGDYAKEDMVALSCTEGERTVENETSSVWAFVATPPIPT
ncbi:Peptidase-M1-N domain-containing protein [Aphelenchoides fujianensis]|nr:Peptidase-M1-N domain-containing protein [Aphelenchoides fujianensis]